MATRKRNPLLAALLLGLLLLAAPGHAQRAAAWKVENGRESVSVRPARGQGYEALPASSLLTLGAEVSSRGTDVEVRLGEAELHFQVGSRVFVQGAEFRHLPHPVYREQGVTYLPLYFFVEVLPTLGVRVDPAARVIRGAVPARPAAASPAPPRREAPRAAAPARAPRRLVVVDAGHGGVDPGASGPGGTREKDVALAVARRLAALLREDSTLEVRMTRDRDTLVALRDRSRLANGWRGGERPALFISIHCNANDSRSARGFETYFLAEARTEDARRVAQMENAAQRYEKDAGGGMDDLSFILHDLRQNKYLRDSNDWAARIQEELKEVHPGPDRGVKQAGFYVLNGTFMPAVLVELGFITNPQEEKVLADPAHQRRMAERLARSIRGFLRGDPSPGASP